LKLEIIHEDVLIRLFVFSLEGDPKKWIKYYSGLGKISSFVGLILLFLKCWDPYYDEGRYEEIHEDFTTTFRKDKETPHGQAHQEQEE
jgi:hypothetical protein